MWVHGGGSSLLQTFGPSPFENIKNTLHVAIAPSVVDNSRLIPDFAYYKPPLEKVTE